MLNNVQEVKQQILPGLKLKYIGNIATNAKQQDSSLCPPPPPLLLSIWVSGQAFFVPADWKVSLRNMQIPH